MFSDKVAPQNLNTKRLDSDFYRPEYIEIDNTLSNLNCVKLGTIGKFFTGPFGSLLPSNLYLNEGIPLFRVGNVGQFEALSENFAYLAPSVHEQLKVSEVVPGDLLLVKASVGEKICKVPEWLPKANITQHIIGIRPNQSKDTDYISAFLFCYYGVGQLQRYSLGSIIQYLGITDAKDVNLYSPDPLVQKYIGDKVRQAEQLRAWAKLLRTSVDAHLNSLNLPINEPPALLNRVSAQTMEDRLDPRPYRTHYLCLVREIEKLPHDSISSLAELASGCPVSSNDFLKNSGIPLVRIRNIGFDDFIGLDTGISQDVYQDATKYKAKEKMIVVGMDGIFRAQFFISDELPMLVNQRVAMLSPQSIRGELLTHWLNRPEGQMQLNQWAVKTTVEHTSLSDIGRVLIPRLDKSLENKLSDYLLNARLAYRYAKFLTQVAKTLVEALIEGQLTEQQLIQAQQALEDGDNSLDQAILSKLSAEGYAIEGATPLFSDVDELYSLLEDAAQAEAEE
ncbi:restriction endonuclease subunit S [Klebsiella pneumoniae]|jgi:type I restriction enzyme, S subunit|nr:MULTISPECIES: restriction endonuclease subunit S [Klebsiella]AUN60417.1 restriction endonuclease subunit S [Klebsiella pneumoniae]AUY63817.1 restriction endonuclease [Klebsiella pneumoniae]EIW3898232.1 restriction endonuclease subunit S [Klebsiella pneumoniae]EIW9041532.1 restriction endonuclease subunit S [Klebsiella pneumoniae]EIW9290376.1 restriction endonuclease subunit S [Klebsiella pneumoniae]